MRFLKIGGVMIALDHIVMIEPRTDAGVRSRIHLTSRQFVDTDQSPDQLVADINGARQ